MRLWLGRRLRGGDAAGEGLFVRLLVGGVDRVGLGLRLGHGGLARVWRHLKVTHPAERLERLAGDRLLLRALDARLLVERAIVGVDHEDAERADLNLVADPEAGRLDEL